MCFRDDFHRTKTIQQTVNWTLVCRDVSEIHSFLQIGTETRFYWVWTVQDCSLKIDQVRLFDRCSNPSVCGTLRLWSIFMSINSWMILAVSQAKGFSAYIVVPSSLVRETIISSCNLKNWEFLNINVVCKNVNK